MSRATQRVNRDSGTENVIGVGSGELLDGMVMIFNRVFDELAIETIWQKDKYKWAHQHKTYQLLLSIIWQNHLVQAHKPS
jgi:hypothetical protein